MKLEIEFFSQTLHKKATNKPTLNYYNRKPIFWDEFKFKFVKAMLN